MALIHSFEKSGNFLFKHRGIVPVFVFLLCLPILLCTHSLSLYYGLSSSACVVVSAVAICISLLGFVIRAYTIGTTPHGTSGRNTSKQEAMQLNTTGIYSVVRHPLYLGNYLMWLGLLIFIMDWPFLVAVSLLYWLYYERIMYAEERYLEKLYGETYLAWSLQVPAFLPNFKQFKKSEIPFHFKSVLRREYPGIMAMVLSFTLVDYIRTAMIACFKLCAIPTDCGFWLRPSLYVCVVTLLITIVLRTLKHHTHLLRAEENRD